MGGCINVIAWLIALAFSGSVQVPQ